MRRTRVLFVDHVARLSGGQQDLLDLVVALDRNRVEVHVALPGPGPLEDALRDAGAQVHHLQIAAGLRSLSRWQVARRPHVVLRQVAAFAVAARRLDRIVARVSPDVVHTNSMKSHLLAVRSARKRKIPLIWHVRDILQPGWLRDRFASAAARYPTRVVCLSRVAAEQFRDAGAWGRVRVVYNGIRTERFADAGESAAAARSALGAEPGDVLVGLIGQIAWWKGQDVFVEAAAKVAANHPEVRFAVIGECLFPENEAAFEAGVRERARELGLDGRIVWGGWSDDIAATVGALDVLVHSSRLPEPFGRVIVEGMAGGKPVVASIEGAASEIVPPNAGRLVPPGDPSALAGALDELLADSALRRRIGEAAREAARRFDIAKTARGVMDVYEEILVSALDREALCA